MLTADQIDALGEAARKITDPVTEYLLRDIARRIAEAGQLTSTAQLQVWRTQQLGLSQKEIEKKLRQLLRVSQGEIRRILYQSAQSGYDLDVRRFPTVEAIPFAENLVLQQIVAAAVELAEEDFTNLTQTLGMVDPFGNALPLQGAYRACTDFAFQQVVTGAASYTEAVRQATRNLAEKGLRVIDYESGVHTSLEAAVRRNILGGLGLMQEQISQTVFQQLGCDGWEITAHANSAPDHEPIQGKQYPDAAYQELNNSLRRRIGTLNCGHAAFPIILGVNRPQYTPQELERFRADNEKGVTVDGKHYTGYQATQMQRKLERAIRAQKRRVMVDEATGDGEKLSQDKTRLNILHQRYREFSKAAGLRTQYERTEVAGFGKKGRIGFANGASRDILKGTQAKDLPVTQETIQHVPQIRPNGWSEEQAAQLQTAHQDLLRRVKELPLGTEAGAVYSTDMRLLHSLDGEIGSVGAPALLEPYCLLHTHPDGLTFSAEDIETFIHRFDMSLLTAVGNNGSVYAVHKLKNYVAADFYKAFWKVKPQLEACATAEEFAQLMNEFLRGAHTYGIEFISGG